MNLGEVQVFLQQGDPGSVPAQVYFVVERELPLRRARRVGGPRLGRAVIGSK
ncbi:MAG TPA: hypothetical protein VF461_15355 [Gemmatimonadaceae bacterium]